MTTTLLHLSDRVADIANCTGDVANEIHTLANLLPFESEERQELLEAACCYDRAARLERRALGHLERQRRAAA